jgi:hypothetical protein
MPAPRNDPDRPLLFLLLLVNIASAWTTVLGARQVLPSPLAEVLGLTVQMMLFLLLAGFAGRHAGLRRWVAVAVFAAASVYTSFYTYYDQLAAEVDASADLDRAQQAHAAFTASVWAPRRSEVGRLVEEARSLDQTAQREAKDGQTSGLVGYGPVARSYAEQARQKELEVSTLRADLDRMLPAFEFDLAGLSAEGLYQADLHAWQLAPSDWRAAAPAPQRADYIDQERQIGLLTPFYMVRRGEVPAVVALLLALLVDGLAILMGTAIHRQDQPLVSTMGAGAADLISRTKDQGAAVRMALARPGRPTRDGASAPGPSQAVTGVVLRVKGRSSDFLSTVYGAIHPESGDIDFAGLQAHENPSFRIASRVLLDQLRQPELAWVVVDAGWWNVPGHKYSAMTSWLAAELQRCVRAEADAAADPGGPTNEEQTLALVLPLAA